MLDYTRTTLELLYNISRELTSDLDLRTVLVRVLTNSSRHVGAERASIVVVEGDQAVDAAIIVDNQLKPHTVDQLNDILNQGLAGWVLRNRQAVLIPDTRHDQRWLQRPDDAASQTGAKSAICVPIIARDQLVGVLTIVHPIPNTLSKEHLALVQAIADQAGTAIYNARLYNKLDAAHRRYLELFDDSIDPIWITDLDGKTLEANRQAGELTGLGKEEMRGQPMALFLELGDSWLDEHLVELQGGRTVHTETILRSRSGVSVPVEAYVRVVMIENSAVLQWILRDISERKALDALRDDLMAMVYHDLRSPLSNIISSLEMLNMLLPPEEGENYRTILAIAIRSTERMQRLIATLLDIYRLEAGQPITNRQRVEVLPLVQEAVSAVQPVVENKGLEMVVEVEEGLPPLWIDGDMIRRVLINLLDNATKFILFQGTVRLSVRKTGDRVIFSVQDNGPGIPPDKLELIFDKFARLQVDRFPKGLGLGLAFCKLAVRSHGGEIWVESELNAGSTFYFSLPIETPPSEGEL